MTTQSLFIRIVKVSPDSKAIALLEAIRELHSGATSKAVFIVPSQLFASIPSSPFAYWAPPTLLRAFRQHPKYELGERTALQGASTCDDFRYVRTWYEVTPAASRDSRSIQWVGFAKGGRSSPFYADVTAVVPWDFERTTFFGFIGRSGRWNPKPVSADHYFQPALTWPLRGSVFSAAALPSGCGYSVGGKVALAPVGELPFLLGVFNSSAFNAAISLFAGKVGGFQYETGIINAAPVPTASAVQKDEMAALARRAWSLKYDADTRTETSRAFVLPALLQVQSGTLVDRSTAWSKRQTEIAMELKGIQARIDELAFELYGIDAQDRDSILSLDELTSGEADGDNSHRDVAINSSEEDAAEHDDQTTEASVGDASALAAELLSWAVGVNLGRFDIRLATGARMLPREPDPFSPLRRWSPGMLATNGGWVLLKPPEDYPVRLPVDAILIDDLGHSRDLTAAVRRLFDVVFGLDADARWQEAVALVDSSGRDLRAWLASVFFDLHLRRYSKSGRKAPIYWQLATPSRRYSLWLYAHRLTRDTFYHIQQDLIGPKLALEERKLLSLTHEAGPNPTTNQRKGLAEQEVFMEELRAMRDEVARVAPLWNPDLDDGVVITMAPLWRLVPQHRAWQRELQSTWDALAAGKYDWAHLTMHLWPERVVPKCAEDRSLAIAHGLEDVFWEEDSDGRWKRRLSPSRSVEELVRERTSPAVKDALKSLIEAPAPGGGGRATRSRRGRAAGGR